MSLVKRNLIASLASSVVTAVVTLVALRYYVRLLGVEATGVIGLYFLLQALVGPLDFGLSTGLCRELAQRVAQGGSAQPMRDLLRTFEMAYVAVAVLIGIVIVAASPLIGHLWVHPVLLTRSAVTTNVMLIGLAVAAQWPLFIYQGGLTGLQRQVSLSVIGTVMQAVRFGGVIPLMIAWPSLELFFAYQAAASLAQAAITRLWLWRCMPKSPGRAVFRWGHLKALRYFAAGMSGISITVLIINQLDKVLLSGLGLLEAFGYYTIAVQAAGGLSRVFGPILPATLPRFAELIARDQWAELAALYHRCAQLLSVMLFPLAAILAVWASPVLAAWTGEPEVVRQASLVLTLLTIGATLNGLFTLAYSAQLAFSWTKLTLASGVVAIAVTIPTMIVATRLYGAPGAAAAAILPNAIQLLIGVTLMHRRILKGELRRWVVVDVAMPLLACGAVAAIAAAVVPFGGSLLDTLAKLIAIAFVCLLACVLAAPQIRAIALGYLGIGRRNTPAA